MRRGALVPAAAGAAMLALIGCSALDPYATAPATLPPTAPPGARVAICYDRVNATPADVQKAAQRECPSGTAATLADTDWHMDFCPLLLPWRATFVCAKAK